MSLRPSKLLVAPLLGAALLAGCAADDETLLEPVTQPVSEIFERYAALGNSITAGFQSAGINDSTQLRAYPVLLARQAGAEAFFTPPLLSKPGCPPPLVAPFSTQVLGGAQAPPCALRVRPTARVNNLAVPAANIASLLDVDVAANALTTFVLGGESQLDRMRELQPTLVSVWIGNNDALGAGLTGNPAALTPLAAFEASLDGTVAAIQQTPAGADDAVVLIGVVDPTVVPALLPGVFAFLVKQNPQTAPLLPQSVSATCAPVTPTGQPNPNAFNSVSLLVTTSGAPEISCAPDAPFVLTPAEAVQISQRVAEYNAAIEARAAANGWIYVDPNDILAPRLADPDQIRKCQQLPAALQTGNPQAILAAVAASCPSPDPSVGFGALISHDGIHPSSQAHRLVANAIIAELNATFGLSIPQVTG